MQDFKTILGEEYCYAYIFHLSDSISWLYHGDLHLE